MVASRSDTKRRRRDSSPLDSNSKRTKVHAQRKFAQGVTSLGNLLNVSPVKDKSDKARSNGLSGSPANGLKASESTENVVDGASSGKRALPARGAKKPSIEDMITFLCYRGTSALPPRLAHLNKAPSPEPQAGQSKSGKVGDRTNKDGDKPGNKKSLKSALPSAQKAVTAAQALKRKYQEQRIKKTSVSTLAKKVKATPLLRTTRSTANAVTCLPSTAVSKRAAVKKSDLASSSRKRDSSVRNEQNLKKSNKTPSGKQSTPTKVPIATHPASGSRGGLRSNKQEPETVLRSSSRKVGSGGSLKKKKPSAEERQSQQSKTLATSLSDFSSEDDQPLVKKHKPLVQVQKLIKKSIANIGRKMKMEPRRSKRCLPSSPVSPASRTGTRLAALSSQSPSSSSSANIHPCVKGDDKKPKSSSKRLVSPSVKDVNSSHPKNQPESQKKDLSTSKSSNPRMKKGYAMELVHDSSEPSDLRLETRSRRGSRDLREVPTGDKTPQNQSSAETSKIPTSESKRKDSSQSGEVAKKSSLSSPKPVNPKPSVTPQSPGEVSLSAVLKSPPDLRIPPSIKRPLTAVGITNPMAIAAAAAVVCKNSAKVEDKGKLKDSITTKESSKDKKAETKRKDSSQSRASPKVKCKEDDNKAIGVQTKSKHNLTTGNKSPQPKKDPKNELAKPLIPIKANKEDSSDEDSKPIISMASSEKKKPKVKQEPSDLVKELIDDDSKLMRSSRRGGLKSLSDDDEISLSLVKAGKSAGSLKKSSDEEGSKQTPRGRRSTIRSMKKVLSSDDESMSESATLSADAKETKVLHQSSKKVPDADIKSESDLNPRPKRRSVVQSKVQSSDEEVSGKGTKKSLKKLPPSYDEDSSEVDDSGGNDSSDDASLSASKPSTRSAAKSEIVKRTSLRATRSGQKVLSVDIDTSSTQPKHKQNSQEDSSSEDSDSERTRAPKTRSKAVKSTKSKRGTRSESSDDATDEDTEQKPVRPTRRSTAHQKRAHQSADSRSSSSESSYSCQDDDVNSASKNKSNRKLASAELVSKPLSMTSKSNRTSLTSKSKQMSDDASDGKKKSKQDCKEKQDKLKEVDKPAKRSLSPRRSSRRSVQVKTCDSKNESSASETSSSESSPSQNRRVLRERREFFSFAEVDPPSDSEEEVLAATKASLEMISQQTSRCEEEPTSEKLSVSANPSDPKENSKKEGKNKSSESVKEGKKTKSDLAQPKKSSSKKRVKAPSEVESNLNDELEKTLLSINLSPQMSKSMDKSPEDSIKSVHDKVSTSGSHVCDTSTTKTSTFIPTSSSGTTPLSKPRKVSSKAPAVSTSAATEKTAATVKSASHSGLMVPSAQLVLSSSASLVPMAAPAIMSNNILSANSLPVPSKTFKLPTAVPSLAPVSVTHTIPCVSMPSGSVQQGIFKGSSLASNMISSAASSGHSTTSTLSSGSVISSGFAGVSGTLNTSAPLLSGSIPAPLSTQVQGAIPAQMTQVPVPASSVSASLSTSIGLSMPAPIPVSMSIPLATQLGIPLQTSGNVPMSVPMSGTMTLPLQVGPLPSGASAGTPFLLPVQSALAPILAPGQTIIKKEAGNLGGMPNPVGNTSQLMVGMNPLVVNSNRGAFILSTGSTMTMTSSQQQIVPGPLMPSLLSLRLPDKPSGHQTIMANPPLYVPFAFGNPGIIQAQGQVQPQIQTVTGVSTITAMASNIQNTLGSNLQNTVAPNIQSAISSNIHNSVAINARSAVSSCIQNPPASTLQTSTSASGQNTASVSSAITLSQSQGSGAGTGMKRQLVLATKNGPVSKLILSVGEDGSHVLAAASPNTIPASEGQTLMSVMQPVQSSKSPGPAMNVSVNQNLLPIPSTLTRQSTSAIAPKPSSGTLKGPQPVSSNVTTAQTVKQSTIQSPIVSFSSTGQPTLSTLAGSQMVTSSARSQQISVSCLPSSIQSAKPVSISGCSANALPAFKGIPAGTIILSSPPSFTPSTAATMLTQSTVSTIGSCNVSTVLTTSVACSKGVVSNVSVDTSNTRNTLSSAKPVLGAISAGMKLEAKSSPMTSIKTSTSIPMTSFSASPLQDSRHVSTNVSSPASVTKALVGASGIAAVGTTSIQPIVSKSVASSSAASLNYITSSKMTPMESPGRSVDKSGDLVVTTAPSLNPPAVPVLTSRIPSAPAALAALKSPSGAPCSTRAIAKTGSSRKPYSTAASYAAGRTSDLVASSETKIPSTTLEPPPKSLPAVAKSANIQQPPALTSSPKITPDTKSSPSPILGPPSGPVSVPTSGTSESKRRGTEVELAPTHRTLSMLSTAFQGNIMSKDRKREIPVKRTGAHHDAAVASSEKQNEEIMVTKSGLESLAEVATSLAERSAETGDKRMPEHSLWANPAQILGQETLRVPGLPITANVGTNLPTKNDLAKMKSGAVLADVIEKRLLSDVDKLSKGKANLSTIETEKPCVSGLLASSKADTPRQKVQKWLDDGSKGDHKGNCGLLSNGSSCTCDVVEDISNLNSLAEVCVSMERIDSPVKDTKVAKISKQTIEKKKKQDAEAAQNTVQSPTLSVKAPLPLDSHQMKVTWQNAFGVKSPVRSSKAATSSQPKRVAVPDEIKKIQAPDNEVPAKKACERLVQSPSKASPSKNYGNKQGGKNEGAAAGSAEESAQQRKLAQRRSILSRAADPSCHKLGTSAFSADNESSVYAFEAETDAPPVSQPFRRRSKTLSRSDEEDSTSGGSMSNPNTVHVSKDPVFVPIQVEVDENSSADGCDKNGVPSAASKNDNTGVFYIPLCGQEGSEGDVRAVAVRLGKEGPNNRVVMSAKLVNKPPTFKHPNDTSEDGILSKKAKLDSTVAPQPLAQLPIERGASSSKQLGFDSNIPAQGPVSDGKVSPDKKKSSQKETLRPSLTDSSSEDTSSLPHIPSSRDVREARGSMSPSSSTNKSPVSDKASPSVISKKKGQERLNRQSSLDSDNSEKAKSSRRGSKSKSASSRASPSPSLPSTSSTSSGPSRPSQKSKRAYNGPVPGNVSEAPVFHPTEKEFQDPYAYIEKIRPVAEKYGLCRIVAPHSFKPDCNVEDDIRFTADNQYVHKMMDRWGPNAKEMRAIVKYIAQHNIHLKHAPLVGGMELDLPRLYTTVQNFGGLMEVMDKKRWVKVAETMRIPKSAQDRASKLDEVYCKCLLPYETLKTSERDNLFEMVEVEWEMRKERREKRLAASAASPDQSVTDAQHDDEEDEEEEEEDDEEDECIVKGRSMPLTTFYRTARNTTHMWFKGSSPSASEVEHEFWRHVRDRNFHICVNAGSVDCSDPPYGFPTRNSPFAKHPWNLKVFSNSNGSVLRSLGSVIGVTVPTLHFGMVFTTCCWYRDPHGLPWIEYLHTGAKKIWYGIPEHGAEKFQAAMQEVAPHYVRKKALWLASDTAMIPPNMLTERKVPLCRTVQEPGQFIVVFPKAHTSSVATGYIVSESVSFAPLNWLSSALESFKEMQKCNEPPLFSLDKLIFSIAEDPRSSLDVLNTILPSAMEILEREITYQQELKKKGIKTCERVERKTKHSTKKAKSQKETEDPEVMECDVCSTNLFLSMIVNTEDDAGYCLIHASSYVDQDKLNPSQCKLLYSYSQNELHEFLQNLLDRIEAKSGKKGNFSSNNSDSGSSVSTSTRH